MSLQQEIIRNNEKHFEQVCRLGGFKDAVKACFGFLTENEVRLVLQLAHEDHSPLMVIQNLPDYEARTVEWIQQEQQKREAYLEDQRNRVKKRLAELMGE